MQFSDINNIILPLFISTATPVEKQRDTIMSTSHAQVLAYCKDMPMAKQKDYSYPCRQQIEADCVDLGTSKACDLLAKLKDAERDAREKQIAAREKIKGTTFWCVVPPPEIVSVIQPEWKIVKANPRRKPAASEDFLDFAPKSINLLTEEETRKFPAGIQEQMIQLHGLRERILESSIPIKCSSDSECEVEGIGRGCGRKFIYYSTTQGRPQIIQDILAFDKLDGTISDQRKDILECAVIYPRHEAVCRENKCTAGPKQIGY